MNVVALVNDTVGTLVSRAYTDPSCRIGVILGTGTNASYVERMQKLPKLQPHSGDGLMLINMEWGNFGSVPDSHLLPFHSVDRVIDKTSPNPGQQLYEKMISGEYLGEIVRLLVEQLAAHGSIWSANSSPDPDSDLLKPYGLSTRDISFICK